MTKNYVLPYVLAGPWPAGVTGLCTGPRGLPVQILGYLLTTNFIHYQT